MNDFMQLLDLRKKQERITSNLAIKNNFDFVVIISETENVMLTTTKSGAKEHQSQQILRKVPEGITCALAAYMDENACTNTHKLEVLERLAYRFGVMTPEIQFALRDAWMQQHQEE